MKKVIFCNCSFHSEWNNNKGRIERYLRVRKITVSEEQTIARQ